MLIICSSILVTTTYFGNVKAQSGTQVAGIIYTDTTWTKANSPYTLTGAIGIYQGVTLTIEAGVTVNFNFNYMQVNGTLVARGTNAEKIQLADCIISFTSLSKPWNEQTNTGSIIEYAKITRAGEIDIISISDASPKLNNIEFWVAASTTIYVAKGAPIISNCTFNNISTWSRAFYVIALYDANATVLDNTINGGYYGIRVNWGNSTIKRNVITNCEQALRIDGGFDIENNMIAENNIGIYCSYAWGRIEDNTFQNNRQNFRLSSIYNVDATYNWWGTISAQAIGQSIYDYKNDFNLGNVTFIPYLNAPSIHAPTYVNASAGVGGLISSSGITKLNYGDSQIFTITPNSGYHITNVLVNGTSVGVVSSYVIQDITGVTTIYATFAPDPTLTPTPRPSPTPTPTTNPTTQPTSNPTSNPANNPTSNPSPTPTVPELPVIVILPLLVALFTVAVLLRKQPKIMSR